MLFHTLYLYKLYVKLASLASKVINASLLSGKEWCWLFNLFIIYEPEFGIKFSLYERKCRYFLFEKMTSDVTWNSIYVEDPQQMFYYDIINWFVQNGENQFNC